MCLCSMNPKWSALEVCLFWGFLCVAGSDCWSLEGVQIQKDSPSVCLRSSPHLPNNVWAPSLLSFQFRGLWFIPWNTNYNTQGLLCAKNICHCLNVLAGSVYSIQTGPMVRSSSAKIITQTLFQGKKCSSPELPAELWPREVSRLGPSTA